MPQRIYQGESETIAIHCQLLSIVDDAGFTHMFNLMESRYSFQFEDTWQKLFCDLHKCYIQHKALDGWHKWHSMVWFSLWIFGALSLLQIFTGSLLNIWLFGKKASCVTCSVTAPCACSLLHAHRYKEMLSSWNIKEENFISVFMTMLQSWWRPFWMHHSLILAALHTRSNSMCMMVCFLNKFW